MKVVWSRRAIHHLAALSDHIARDSAQHAARVAQRILDSIELLQTQPALGGPGRIPGTRELVIPNTPSLVPYRVRRDCLELLAVFHGHQKWPSSFQPIASAASGSPTSASLRIRAV